MVAGSRVEGGGGRVWVGAVISLQRPVLVSFLSTWHKLELSKGKEPQLRKYLLKI